MIESTSRSKGSRPHICTEAARGQYHPHRYYSPAVQYLALRVITLRQYSTLLYELHPHRYLQLAVNRQPGYRQGPRRASFSHLHSLHENYGRITLLCRALALHQVHGSQHRFECTKISQLPKRPTSSLQSRDGYEALSSGMPNCQM